MIATPGTGRRIALVTMSLPALLTGNSHDLSFTNDRLIAAATPAAAQNFQSTTMIDKAVAGLPATRSARPAARGPRSTHA